MVRPALFAALILLAGPVAAEDLDAPIRPGIALLAADPRLDLRGVTRRPGFGVALFGESEARPGLMLRTRLDYLAFRQSDQPPSAPPPGLLPEAAQRVSANALNLGVELRWRLGSTPLSLSIGGLGGRYEFRSLGYAEVRDGNGLPVQQLVRGKTRTQIRLGAAAGLAFHIKPGMDFTVRVVHLPVPGAALNTLEGALAMGL